MEDRPGTIARPREIAVVSLAGVALAILMTWPLATGLGHLGRTAPTNGDGQLSIWNISWVARTVVVDPLRVFDANVFHPHKTTLAYSEANLLPGVIGIPVYWASGNPWLTLNAVMLVAFASAFACTYLLLLYLTGDRRASVASAVVYAFCPYVMSHLSHIQLLFTAGIPLSLLMLHRLADGPSVRRGAVLGLALAAQALSCAYYGIFAGLMIGYGALVLAGTRRLWKSATYWTAIATGAATSILLVLPFFLPFLRVQKESGFARSLADTQQWAARPREYLASATHVHAWLLDLARRAGPVYEVLFPGLFVIVLGLAGVALAIWSGRRTTRDRETAILYGTLGILAFWASFGPAAGLYRILYNLPFFTFLRAPSRLGLVVVLCLGVFASIALRHGLATLAAKRRLAAAALAVALAIADVAVFPIRWDTAPQIPPGYDALADSPRGPLAEFPFYGDRVAFPLHTQYMLFSTRHWLPLVNGYSDVIPADFREIAPVLDGFPSGDAFLALARRRVRYIAVHWDMYVNRQDEIRRRLAPYAANLKILSEDSRMTLYEVVRYP